MRKFQQSIGVGGTTENKIHLTDNLVQFSVGIVDGLGGVRQSLLYGMSGVKVRKLNILAPWLAS